MIYNNHHEVLKTEKYKEEVVMIFNSYNAGQIEGVLDTLGGKTVGLTSGCFDMFHRLHLEYLIRCRRKCDILIVGVDSDDLVRATKGPSRPIIDEYSRSLMVDSTVYVDFTFIMDDVKNFGRIVRELGVAKIFKNDAFIGKTVEGGEKAELVIIPDIVPTFSTSDIIESIVIKELAKMKGGKAEEK
jgi:D-beta-D-heptose 7-phosphate kinase/D-beta-D-heptose 1-phosphate adenosyltransferase